MIEALVLLHGRFKFLEQLALIVDSLFLKSLFIRYM